MTLLNDPPPAAQGDFLSSKFWSQCASSPHFPLLHPEMCYKYLTGNYPHANSLPGPVPAAPPAPAPISQNSSALLRRGLSAGIDCSLLCSGIFHFLVAPPAQRPPHLCARAVTVPARARGPAALGAGHPVPPCQQPLVSTPRAGTALSPAGRAENADQRPAKPQRLGLTWAPSPSPLGGFAAPPCPLQEGGHPGCGCAPQGWQGAARAMLGLPGQGSLPGPCVRVGLSGLGLALALALALAHSTLPRAAHGLFLDAFLHLSV